MCVGIKKQVKQIESIRNPKAAPPSPEKTASSLTIGSNRKAYRKGGKRIKGSRSGSMNTGIGSLRIPLKGRNLRY